MHFTTALPLSVALAALPFLTGSNAQSASSSAAGTQSQSGSSAMPSASGSPGAGGQAGGFLSDYLTFLNSSGYTSLSSAIQQANQTQSGQSWLTELSDRSWTVFAPTNQACEYIYRFSSPSSLSTLSSILCSPERLQRSQHSQQLPRLSLRLRRSPQHHLRRRWRRWWQ